MTHEELLRQLIELAAKRDEKYYAWIRQLLVLATGALTALVAFRADAHSMGIALWSLRLSWVALGLSILLGSLVLHGEVWSVAELARRAGEKAKEQFSSGDLSPSPVFAMRPARYKRADELFRLCLVIAVLALVVHALFRQ